MLRFRGFDLLVQKQVRPLQLYLWRDTSSDPVMNSLGAVALVVAEHVCNLRSSAQALNDFAVGLHFNRSMLDTDEIKHHV